PIERFSTVDKGLIDHRVRERGIFRQYRQLSACGSGLRHQLSNLFEVCCFVGGRRVLEHCCAKIHSHHPLELYPQTTANQPPPEALHPPHSSQRIALKHLKVKVIVFTPSTVTCNTNQFS